MLRAYKVLWIKKEQELSEKESLKILKKEKKRIKREFFESKGEEVDIKECKKDWGVFWRIYLYLIKRGLENVKVMKGG